MSETITAPPTAPGIINPRKRLRLPETVALLVFLLAEVVFFSLTSKYFLSWDNFVNIFSAVSVVGILAAGATILLIGGQFDLSIGSGVAWVGLMFALLSPILGVPTAVLIAAA